MFGQPQAFGGNSGGFGGSKSYGGKPQHNNKKKFRAVICRVTPKIRFDDKSVPRIDVLLLKYKSGHYGLVQCLDHGKGKTSASAAKHYLRKEFVKQCGTAGAWTSGKLEAPPLIPVESISGDNWIFLLPSYLYNWSPNPSNRSFNFLDYGNEQLQFNGKPFQCQNGAVWVDFQDFTAQCQQGGSLITKELIDYIPKQLPAIFTAITNKLKIAYHRTLSCSRPSIGSVLIYQETQLQIKIEANYSSSEFNLEIVNMSNNSPVQIVLDVCHCPNPSLLQAIPSLQVNALQEIQKLKSIKCSVKLDIKGYFGYGDLPTFVFKYLTTDGAHQAVLRLPIFLFRYSTKLAGLEGASAEQTKNNLLSSWGSLPQESNFNVPMGPVNDAQKKRVWEELEKSGLPTCTPFDNFFPIVPQLGDRGAIFLLQFQVQGGETTLNVMCKHNEPKLCESISELIYGYAINNPGLDASLIDPPVLPPQ